MVMLLPLSGRSGAATRKPGVLLREPTAASFVWPVMRLEILSTALAEYESAVRDFEAIHLKIMRHVQTHTTPTASELLEEERARLRLSELHQSISATITSR